MSKSPTFFSYLTSNSPIIFDYLLIVVVMGAVTTALLVSCVNQEIYECSTACKRGGRAMVSYSTSGCVCATEALDGGAR